MNSIVISFCIPSYNNSQAAFQIVNDLLSSENEDFEVIICDDNSQDDTQALLSQINDKRFRYIRNSQNLGAHKNWLKTLESGRGEWLYLVMGRDKLHVENIDKLIHLLELAGKNNVTCLKDRLRKKDFELYRGINAMIEFVINDHPTGIIFKREVFMTIPNREKYFTISDMYPECYIEFFSLLKGNAAFIMSGVSRGEEPVTDKTKIKSQVEFGRNIYQTYFAPARRIKQFFERIDMIELISNGAFNSYEINKYFGSGFKSLLKDVSYYWRRWCRDNEQMRHYGHEEKYIDTHEMTQNIFTAYHETKKHLREKGTYTLTKNLIMCYYVAKILIRVNVFMRFK